MPISETCTILKASSTRLLASKPQSPVRNKNLAAAAQNGRGGVGKLLVCGYCCGAALLVPQADVIMASVCELLWEGG